MNSHAPGKNIKMVQSLENGLAVPQKWTIELPCDPAMLLWGVNPREKEIYVVRKTRMCIEAHSSWKMEATKMSPSCWMD